jgi:hypothetical protein
MAGRHRHAYLVGMAVLRSLSSPQTWQASFHAVAGMFLGAATGAAVWLLGVLWWAAVVSLVEGPTGSWMLAVLYVVVAVPEPAGRAAPICGSSARCTGSGFRVVLGVEIAVPRHDPGTGWRRLLRPWAAGSTWRQLAYHLLALPLGGLGGLAVMLCWAAPVLVALWSERMSGLWFPVALGGAVLSVFAAPWVARGVAAADTAAARRLLGPDQAEELAERVESLARSRADLVAAADAERRRIERDLHDGVQQRLVSLALNLGMARSAVTGPSERWRSSPRPTTRPPPRWPSSATSCAACTRPCSTTGARRGALRRRHAGAAAGEAARRHRAALLAEHRGDRLFRRVGSADERCQARAGEPGRGHRANASATGSSSQPPTTVAAARRSTARAPGCAGWRSGPRPSTAA